MRYKWKGKKQFLKDLKKSRNRVTRELDRHKNFAGMLDVHRVLAQYTLKIWPDAK